MINLTSQTPISGLRLLGIAYLLGIADVVHHSPGPYMGLSLWGGVWGVAHPLSLWGSSQRLCSGSWLYNNGSLWCWQQGLCGDRTRGRIRTLVLCGRDRLLGTGNQLWLTLGGYGIKKRYSLDWHRHKTYTELVPYWLQDTYDCKACLNVVWEHS